MAAVRVNHRKKSTNTRSKQRSTWNDKQCKETRFYIFNKRLMLLVMIFVIQQTNLIQLVFVFEFYFHWTISTIFCEQKFFSVHLEPFSSFSFVHFSRLLVKIPLLFRYRYYIFWFLLPFISKLYLQLEIYLDYHYCCRLFLHFQRTL